MATYSGSDKRIKYLFENGGGGGGSSTLAGLSDVNLSSPTDGDALVYDATNQEWVNGQGGAVLAPFIYSLEEREIGVWTDGKPLYQKTWDLSPDIEITSSGVLLPSYVSNDLANAENIIWAIAERERNGTSILPAMIHAYVWNSSTTGTAYSVLSADRWSNVSKITIQYTKTTDTAGSGSWTPSGAPAVHYSTDEQVVGTWIDGSTLYEKTFSLSSLNCVADNWTQTSIPRGSMEMIIDISVLIESSTPSIHKGLSGGFINNYVAINSFRTFGTDTGDIAYITIQYTKSS